MSGKGKNKKKFITAWDMSPPVSTMFDSQVGNVLEALREGNAEPLAEEIERGRLDYLCRFLKPDDNARIARALKTGSPLTQAEKRKSRSAEKARDATILSRICYWKAMGLPLFSQTSSDSAIHRAADEYSNSPRSGAPARTPESAYKYIWTPLKKSEGPLDHWILERPLLSFLQGLFDSGVDRKEATKRFLWFGENLLRNSPLVALDETKRDELIRLTDENDTKCRAHLKRIAAVRHKTTYLKRSQVSGQK